MDRRLVIAALLAAVAATAATRAPAFAIPAGLLVPLASLLGAWLGGVRGALLVTAPAAALVSLLGPEGLPALLAAASVGPVAVAMVQRGFAPAAALAVGTIPYALWAVGLAVTGFDPFPAEAEEALTTLLAESAVRGDVPTARADDWLEAAGAAVEVVRRTWVASESTWFWVVAVGAWVVGRRIFGATTLPPLGRFSRFDVPDAVVGALVAGLAAVLVPGEGAAMTAVRTVGWNLVAATGFFWAVRGAAIEWYWMERGGWRLLWRVAFVAGGVILFLPAFLAATLGLGLFDTWFDFRRVRSSEEGGNPFSISPPTSGDDFPKK